MIQGTHKKFIVLLFIVIIGCLGALPIAPHFLVPIKLQPTKTVAPTTTTYTEGQCTTDVLADSLKQIQSAKPAVTPPAALAEVWTNGKYTADDYTNFVACATTFANNYETFDYHQMQSLYTAIPLLSSDAKKRFYQGYTNTSANVRTNQDWEKQLEKTETTQQAKTSPAKYVTFTDKNKELFLTFDIPCQLTQHIQGKLIIQNISLTVLLKKVQPDKDAHGVGWQISDWRENESAK